MRRREPDYYRSFPPDVRRLLRALGSPRVPNYAGRLIDRPKRQAVRFHAPPAAESKTEKKEGGDARHA